MERLEGARLYVHTGFMLVYRVGSGGGVARLTFSRPREDQDLQQSWRCPLGITLLLEMKRGSPPMSHPLPFPLQTAYACGTFRDGVVSNAQGSSMQVGSAGRNRADASRARHCSRRPSATAANRQDCAPT
ncbi:hypothetical protein N9L68_05705 [bacterium]|nr:hypothetical protein [bacterium]